VSGVPCEAEVGERPTRMLPHVCGRPNRHVRHCRKGRQGSAKAHDMITTALSDVSERLPVVSWRAWSSSWASVSDDLVQMLAQPRERGRCASLLLASRFKTGAWVQSSFRRSAVAGIHVPDALEIVPLREPGRGRVGGRGPSLTPGHSNAPRAQRLAELVQSGALQKGGAVKRTCSGCVAGSPQGRRLGSG
jgi:hypothetical protein